jgi:hypothetical protein
MSLITILIVILVVGILLWVVNAKIPMDDTIKMILNAVVVISLVIWLLKAFGVWSSIANIHI